MDWNEAVKSKSKGLGSAARQYREDSRQAMLAGHAPDFILDEWWAERNPPAPSTPAVELPELHPTAARGLLDYLNDRRRRMSKSDSAEVRQLLTSIEARAAD